MKILIKELRNKLGLSQPDFAKKIGISVSYLRDLEHQRYIPRLQKLEKIAKILNISIKDLIED
ncbi:helix-turn-helix domain-containing protein [Candidatus Margulisiibacteriota bacterium]